MTYSEDGNGDGKVVSEIRTRMEVEDDSCNGDYVKLSGESQVETGICCGEALGGSSSGSGWLGCVWYWIKLVFLFASLAVLAGVFLKWIAPYFIDKEIIPIINWEKTTFSVPMLAFIVFASIALFPTLLLPSSPSMWMAGMTFGYGFGFLLIIAGAAIGVSLPYFIGSLFLHKIQGWLEKYPKRAAILRAAGEGNWLNQFRAVTLIRISPFPYIIYNYCAVATHVKYGPYIFGSLVGMVPEVFLAMYTGILIWTLADASQEQRSLSASQIIFNIVGFLATVSTTIIITIYAKRKLRELQHDDGELLLQ